MRRLELPHREAPDPKSGVSTNFTTSALNFSKKDLAGNSKPKSGTPSTIRTYGLRLRRALLYPAELWKHEIKLKLKKALHKK